MKKSQYVLVIGAAVIIAAVSLLLTINFGDAEMSTYALEDSSSTCIECHGVMTGLSPLHAQLECVGCHKGDNTLTEKDSSHHNMIRVPGNLADAKETCGICHLEAVERINQSLMTSNSGIIAVDKYILGEFDSPNRITHVNEVEHSMADEHLRALCLRCHLGSDKKIYSPIDELSRGGGCNACHLNYNDEAKSQLELYLADSTLPSVHPSLDLQITDEHCFGCHSRSGRISTNYQGYHETLFKKEELATMSGYKELQDERIFKYINEDIHHERGMACIDCHGYDGVMGDGQIYAHEEEAVKISCEDCHAINLKSQQLDELDFVQQRIIKIRNFEHRNKPLLFTSKDSTIINNAYINDDGKGQLVSKISGEEFDLLPPSSACSREYGHNSLTCTSCHTQWAPQCIGCHVTYEPNADGYDLLEKKEMQGSWVEYAGSFLYGPPTLGVRETETGNTVEPAIPGMIMTVDKGSFQPHAMPSDTSAYRLFAPASPHTIGAEGRDCKSCHNNPLALGYGRGKLQFYKTSIEWTFTPEYANLEDGLPADAWTGFLEEPTGLVSTRINFRPFTIDEQKRILRVGACLTCHDNGSSEMKNSLHTDFNRYILDISDKCILIYP